MHVHQINALAPNHPQHTQVVDEYAKYKALAATDDPVCHLASDWGPGCEDEHMMPEGLIGLPELLRDFAHSTDLGGRVIIAEEKDLHERLLPP